MTLIFHAAPLAKGQELCAIDSLVRSISEKYLKKLAYYRSHIKCRNH